MPDEFTIKIKEISYDAANKGIILDSTIGLGFFIPLGILESFPGTIRKGDKVRVKGTHPHPKVSLMAGDEVTSIKPAPQTTPIS